MAVYIIFRLCINGYDLNAHLQGRHWVIVGAENSESIRIASEPFMFGKMFNLFKFNRIVIQFKQFAL